MLHRLAFVSSLAAVVACGSSTPTTPTTPTTPAATGPVYGALFENGRSWTFDGTHKVAPPLDMGPATEGAIAAFTCTVSNAHAMGATQMATVTCEGREHDTQLPPAGLWLANASGLWWYEASQEGAAHEAAMAGTMPAEAMLIGATPTAGRRERGSEEDGFEAYEVSQKDGAWCVAYVMAMGDEGGYELCFPSGGGLRGSTFSAGATSFDTMFRSR